jgi:hypothetical protein
MDVIDARGSTAFVSVAPSPWPSSWPRERRAGPSLSRDLEELPGMGGAVAAEIDHRDDGNLDGWGLAAPIVIEVRRRRRQTNPVVTGIKAKRCKAGRIPLKDRPREVRTQPGMGTIVTGRDRSGPTNAVGRITRPAVTLTSEMSAV